MSLAAGACYVNDAELFRLLDDALLKKIAQKSKVHTFKKKRGASYEFPLKGKVYIIHEGLVFLSYIDVNGKKIILDILSPGSVFGDLDFTGNTPSKYENLFIEPFKEAGVCEMSRKDFQEILQNNPKFMLSILSSLSKKLIGLENKVGTLFFSDVEARLISQIVNLGQKYGTEDDRKVTLKMKITHEKLAQMIGAARETVTETLSNLKKRGIIKTNSKNHLTLHKNKLTRLYT